MLQLATGVFALFFSGVMGVIIMLFALLTVWYGPLRTPLSTIATLTRLLVWFRYIFSIRNRIPFASANLKAALTAVQKYPATFFVAFGALVVHLLWIVLVSAWSHNVCCSPTALLTLCLCMPLARRAHMCTCAQWALALFGVEANTLGDGYICEFLMLVSFYWGIQVRLQLSASYPSAFVQLSPSSLLLGNTGHQERGSLHRGWHCWLLVVRTQPS